MAQLMLGTKKVLMQVVHEGRSLSTLFDAFNEVERPAIQSLTYATLRDWTHAQIRLYKHLSKKPSKELDVLLTVAAMLINNRGRDQNQYAVPTIVNEAVKAAAMSPKTKHAQGLTNAVLRKVASTTLCQAEMHGQFGLPFPDWWLRRIRTAYPDQWESICRRQQEPPPLTLRVNQMMNTRADYEAKLEHAGIVYQTISEIAGIPLRSALMIDVPLPVSQLPEWWDGNLFDKILLDVPCSASGIVRRHPDIVFLRKQQDIVHLVETQRAILENVWMMLKNGGTLLYLTCSIFPEEGEEQITRFVRDHPNALRLEAPGQLLPSEHHDGFFYGLLKKHQP
ncbi:MAG: hypothetical protein EBW34_00090 [Burkholderiaceae bacterium]|nr:hypothetical protein [Burkholderiaceae bacterium]